MRIGAIVVADLKGIRSVGVVKSYDNGITAVFPTVGPSMQLELTEQTFAKESRGTDEGCKRAWKSEERGNLGNLLRQLTGIKYEHKTKEVPEKNTTEDVLGELEEAELEGNDEDEEE
jgi:hypothetical protein